MFIFDLAWLIRPVNFFRSEATLWIYLFTVRIRLSKRRASKPQRTFIGICSQSADIKIRRKKYLSFEILFVQRLNWERFALLHLDLAPHGYSLRHTRYKYHLIFIKLQCFNVKKYNDACSCTYGEINTAYWATMACIEDEKTSNKHYIFFCLCVWVDLSGILQSLGYFQTCWADREWVDKGWDRKRIGNG